MIESTILIPSKSVLDFEASVSAPLIIDIRPYDKNEHHRTLADGFREIKYRISLDEIDAAKSEMGNDAAANVLIRRPPT